MADWIPSLAVLAAFTPAVLIIAIMPGPDMAIYLGSAIARGRRAGFAALIGTNAGLIVHAMFAAFGLSALLAASQTAFMTVKVAGAVYLLYLAWQALRGGSVLSISGAPNDDGSEGGGSEGGGQLVDRMLTAFGVNLLNPKIVLFYVTFLPQFVSPADPFAFGKLLFLGLYYMALSLPIVVCLILFADAIAARLRRSQRAIRALDYTFAGLMSAFAARLLLTRA